VLCDAQIEQDCGLRSFLLRLVQPRHLLAAIPRRAGWLETTVACEPVGELSTVTAGDASVRRRFRVYPRVPGRAARDRAPRVDGTRATVVFNPACLALLAMVGVQTRSGRPCTAHFQLLARDDEPARVPVGETFRAMFMPVRNAG
jgi:hypothetical protein